MARLELGKVSMHIQYIITTSSSSEHLLDEIVDFVRLLSACTAFIEMVELLPDEASLGWRELHWPEKIGRSSKFVPNCEDFMNQIFYRLNSHRSQPRLHDRVSSQRDALTADLAKAAFVNDFLHAFQIWKTVSCEGFNQAQHLDGRGVYTDEYTVVYLSKSQKLKNFLHFGWDADDTSNSYYEE